MGNVLFSYRFCVDSEMTFDMDLPALKSEQGGYCNMIKVKVPSVSAPQWNKAPRPKTNAKIGRSRRQQPLRSASSSKIGRKGEAAGRADLVKSKSTPKVGAPGVPGAPGAGEVVQVQELRLGKCLSSSSTSGGAGAADDTLILPAEGDNVLSQADTFAADMDGEDDLISDEDVPDLEDAFVTAVSGKQRRHIIRFQ